MRRLLIVLSFVIIGMIMFSTLFYSVLANQNAGSQASLQQDEEDPEPRRGYHRETGYLSFLGAEPGKPIIVASAMRPGLPPKAQANAVLEQFGEEFGLRNPSTELTIMGEELGGRGQSTVRYQQVHNDIPILAGELIVNMDSKARLLSINGEISPDIALATIPAISSDRAIQTALLSVSRLYRLEPGELEGTPPDLWIYDARLLRPSDRLPLLVWRTEISSNKRLDVRELVLVDAQNGFIVLQFNQIDSVDPVVSRLIYDNQNNRAAGLPGTGPVRIEGRPPSAIAEVNLAYEYSADTYYFYLNEHGRDSLDNAGMQLISTVRYCDPDPLENCPFANAFWNGEQMVYGEGFAAADDVVGHELTHGVTDNTSRLFYYYQSGAINESLSDVWGEFIDLTNSGGNDTDGVRWELGEDVPVFGAIRDMSNPPAFKDPDDIDAGTLFYRINGKYYCGESDSGGVHTNSGVNNKAAYLMTDGGSFNGKTVGALGISKVADLYYEVQTNILTSGSNFLDLYNSLIQASKILGFSSSEQQSVQDALDAVKMSARPCGDQEPPPVCPVGEMPISFFFDDLENIASGNWVTGSLFGPNHWYYPQNPNSIGFYATYGTSGIYNFWGYDTADLADYFIAMTSEILLPENAYLHFNHDWNFDAVSPTYYDGGVVEYSIDGNPWQDAGSLFAGNGYNGSLHVSNQMGSRSAFVGESHGYTSSKIDLSTLSGEAIRIRFRIGTDGFPDIDDYGWFIDDIRIYVCGSPLYLPIVSK